MRGVVELARVNALADAVTGCVGADVQPDSPGKDWRPTEQTQADCQPCGEDVSGGLRAR